jgi:hypothetical protein
MDLKFTALVHPTSSQIHVLILKKSKLQEIFQKMFPLSLHQINIRMFGGDPYPSHEQKQIKENKKH